ncbi:methyltransferase [Listeria monocytogenes]|nr:methyltransferase [Listeria monocytogenes]
MITHEIIEAQRLLFSKPILIGEKIAVKLLTVRNRHFGILDGVTVPNRIMVDIDPKFVFGNGIHATTQMVTEAIEKHITEGARVLDIGCGTGIQSIISVLLGAEKVESVDIASEAVKTTEHNAKLNNVADRITARVGSLTEGASGSYDLIVANILADPIIELLGNLAEFTHEETTIVLSGIKDIRENDVLETAKDFEVIERHIRDGWVCLVMKRK